MPRNRDSVLWWLMGASLWEWMAVIGVLFAGACLIFLVRRWLHEDEDPAAESHQLLRQFGDLHREGDLSEQEFRLIKSRLIGRLERETASDAATRKATSAGTDPAPSPSQPASTNSVNPNSTYNSTGTPAGPDPTREGPGN